MGGPGGGAGQRRVVAIARQQRPCCESVALGPRTIWHYIMAMPRKIDLEALCNEKGLRITEQRRVIARVLSDADDHPDVEKVYERASAIDPGISISTVYRTVRLFEGAGIPEPHDFGLRKSVVK